jgi:murein DD-endopeptidase MepM/ murein hydrolase activator NlpD
VSHRGQDSTQRHRDTETQRRKDFLFKKIVFSSLLCVSVSLCLCVTSFSARAEEAFVAPEVKVEPAGQDGTATVAQGGAFVIVIDDPSGAVASARAHWDDQTIPCLPSEDRRRWWGFGGVGRKQDPGKYKLDIVIATADGGRIAYHRRLVITRTEFQNRTLTVDPKMINVPAEYKDWVEADKRAFAAARSKSSLTRYWEGPFERPMPGEVTSEFGTQRTYNNSYHSSHGGVDLDAATGDPIHAMAGGKVVMVRETYIAGNTVVIDHGGGLTTSYSHMSGFNVVEDQVVFAGDVIGLAGATGRVTGPHLHWGATIQGVSVNGLTLLPLAPYLQ